MPGNAHKIISWNAVILLAVTVAVALGAALISLPVVSASAGYLVEIIVFENESPDDAGEHWRASEGEPSLQGAIELGNNNAGITEFGPDQSTLTDTLNSLSASGRYRVLAHKIWKQPGYSRDTAKAVRINSVAGRLDGTVRLEGGYYLTLYVDLAYYPRTGIGTAGAIRLTQRRRVRKEEIQYFDHPRYGVLAVVRSIGSGR